MICFIIFRYQKTELSAKSNGDIFCLPFESYQLENVN